MSESHAASDDRVKTQKPLERSAVVAIGAAVAIQIAVVVLVMVLAVTMVRNNKRFDEWKAQLLDHPAPPGAVVLDSGNRFGLLWGNANHCDGEAWILLRGDLSRADLERYYSDILVLRFEESHVTIEAGDTDDTWTVSLLGRIGTAGLDLRCN